VLFRRFLLIAAEVCLSRSIMRNASILLAILAGTACQSENRSALAVAAKMAALRMHGMLLTR
jgi:hypothetical protein